MTCPGWHRVRIQTQAGQRQSYPSLQYRGPTFQVGRPSRDGYQAGKKGRYVQSVLYVRIPEKSIRSRGSGISPPARPPRNQFQKGSPSTRLHGDQARQMAGLLSRQREPKAFCAQGLLREGWSGHPKEPVHQALASSHKRRKEG